MSLLLLAQGSSLESSTSQRELFAQANPEGRPMHGRDAGRFTFVDGKIIMIMAEDRVQTLCNVMMLECSI